jgi:hypothetical protein
MLQCTPTQHNNNKEKENKFLKYIILEFTPSTILLHSPLPQFLE